MRWHEHYLANPKENVLTFVLCPLTVDVLAAPFTAGLDTTVRVFGAVGSEASGVVPQCYFGAVGFDNQNILDFLAGAGRSFGQQLPVTAPRPLWQAIGNIPNSDILRDAGNPVNRSHVVLCALPPGYALSVISVFIQ